MVHFDLTAANPDRAAKFYGQVFGWTFEKWNGPMEYWMVKSGTDKQPGTNGGLARREGGAQAATTTTVDVPSVDETEGNSFGIMQFDPKAK